MVGRAGKTVAFFDGVSSYARVPYSRSLEPKTITVEVMFTYAPTELQYTSREIMHKDTIGDNKGLVVVTAPSTRDVWVSIGYGGGNKSYSKRKIKTASFHYVFSYGYEGARVYGNGELLYSDSSVSEGLEWDGGDLYIGRHHLTDSLFFKGVIYAVRIYDRPLTSEEVARNYRAVVLLEESWVRDGLVLEFIPDTLDCEGGRWVDNSGSGNDAVLVGVRCIEV